MRSARCAEAHCSPRPIRSYNFCTANRAHIASRMPGAVFIKVGSLDQAQSIKLAAEIYVESGFAHSTPCVAPFPCGGDDIDGLWQRQGGARTDPFRGYDGQDGLVSTYRVRKV